MNKKEKMWRKILGTSFKEGDTIKFKCLDMRFTKYRKPVRRTYCYGVILACLSDGDYFVHVVKGGRRGLLHVSKNEIEAWHPRRKHSIV